MVNFIPKEIEQKHAEVPFFEDISAKDVPGRELELPLGRYQAGVSQELAELGATGIYFQEGTFPGEVERHGYLIYFNVYGNRARIAVAALPIRTETKRKRDRALAQALYLLQRKLEAMRLSHVYEPSGVPLVPYLIGQDGRTVEESLVASGALPALSARNGSTPLLEGEVE